MSDSSSSSDEEDEDLEKMMRDEAFEEWCSTMPNLQVIAVPCNQFGAQEPVILRARPPNCLLSECSTL